MGLAKTPARLDTILYGNWREKLTSAATRRQ
jgi:hypothetical protein